MLLLVVYLILLKLKLTLFIWSYFTDLCVTDMTYVTVMTSVSLLWPLLIMLLHCMNLLCNFSEWPLWDLNVNALCYLSPTSLFDLCLTCITSLSDLSVTSVWPLLNLTVSRFCNIIVCVEFPLISACKKHDAVVQQTCVKKKRYFVDIWHS